MGTQIDIYSLIGIALVCIPCTAWYGILRAHYLTLKAGSLRVQVLTARIALFLPTYALLLWLSLTFPSLFGVLEAPIAIAEGLSFYGFFAMIIANLGGPDMCLKIMKSQDRKPCFCCPSDPLKFYNRVKFGLFQFLTIRPIFVTLAALFAYNGNKAGYMIFNICTVVMFIIGFGSIVMFYENLYNVSGNVNGTCKIILLKVSVGAMVAQGLIEELLYSSGTLDIRATDEYSAEQRAQRALCFAVLIEYSVFSLLVYWAFASEISPSEAGDRSVTHINPNDRPDISWNEWVRRVFRIMDLFDGLTPSVGVVEDDTLGGNPVAKDVRNPVGYDTNSPDNRL